MQTAVFGGTFNPLHNGHFEILRDLQNDPSVDEIFLLPDRIPPHKQCDFMADDEMRIEMCRIAAKEFPKVRLCLIEFEREGKSYTYDTVLLLKEKYPDKRFSFVIGGDMLVTFDGWKNYKELIQEVSFIVYPRGDIDEALFLRCIERFRREGMDITLKTKMIPTVSSTEIRNNKKRSTELLPKEIFEFIDSKGVYGE